MSEERYFETLKALGSLAFKDPSESHLDGGGEESHAISVLANWSEQKNT